MGLEVVVGSTGTSADNGPQLISPEPDEAALKEVPEQGEYTCVWME